MILTRATVDGAVVGFGWMENGETFVDQLLANLSVDQFDVTRDPSATGNWGDDFDFHDRKMTAPTWPGVNPVKFAAAFVVTSRT